MIYPEQEYKTVVSKTENGLLCVEKIHRTTFNTVHPSFFDIKYGKWVTAGSTERPGILVHRRNGPCYAGFEMVDIDEARALRTLLNEYDAKLNPIIE